MTESPPAPKQVSEKKVNFCNIEELAKSARSQIDCQNYYYSPSQLSLAAHLYHGQLNVHRQRMASLMLQRHHSGMSPKDRSGDEKSKEKDFKLESVKVKMEPSHIQESSHTKQSDLSHSIKNNISWAPSLVFSSESPTNTADCGSEGSNHEDQREGINDDSGARTRKFRKQRTVFESDQLKVLEEMFEKNQYPTSEEYDQLGSRISIDEQRLRIWFQNRRARHKRSAKSQPHHPVTLLPPIPSSAPYPVSMPSLTNHPLRYRLANYSPPLNPMFYGSSAPYPFLFHPY